MARHFCAKFVCVRDLTLPPWRSSQRHKQRNDSMTYSTSMRKSSVRHGKGEQKRRQLEDEKGQPQAKMEKDGRAMGKSETTALWTTRHSTRHFDDDNRHRHVDDRSCSPFNCLNTMFNCSNAKTVMKRFYGRISDADVPQILAVQAKIWREAPKIWREGSWVL